MSWSSNLVDPAAEVVHLRLPRAATAGPPGVSQPRPQASPAAPEPPPDCPPSRLCRARQPSHPSPEVALRVLLQKRTSALPTTTPSATAPASRTCFRRREAEAEGHRHVRQRPQPLDERAGVPDRACRSPVTPVRLIAYTKPRLASATRFSLSGGSSARRGRPCRDPPPARRRSTLPPLPAGGPSRGRRPRPASSPPRRDARAVLQERL